MGNRALFARVGQALYGFEFHEAIARDLGVSSRSVRYWLDGSRPIPSGVWGELRTLLQAHQGLVVNLLDELP